METVRHLLGADDLPEGQMRGHRLPGDQDVLLVRLDGALHALDDRCNHAGCLLSRGTLSGSEVVCPCHGMTFDARTGVLTCTPRLCGDQRVWPVFVEDGKVWVDVG